MIRGGIVVTESVTSAQAESPASGRLAPAAAGGAADGQAPAAAGLVGRVAGTEDSTPLQFAVALESGSYLQLDDVVVTARDIPGLGVVLTSGIVTQVRARHEGASFGSDVFLISDGVLPARVQEIAEVSTTRVEPEVYVPPRPGEIVRRASGQERAQALYFDQMTSQVPVGLNRIVARGLPTVSRMWRNFAGCFVGSSLWNSTGSVFAPSGSENEATMWTHSIDSSRSPVPPSSTAVTR